MPLALSLILFICSSIYFITRRPKALGQSHAVAMGHSDFLKSRIKWSRSVSVGTIFLFSCVLIKIKLLLFIACLTTGSDFHCSVLRYSFFNFILFYCGVGICCTLPFFMGCASFIQHGCLVLNYAPKAALCTGQNHVPFSPFLDQLCYFYMYIFSVLAVI